jgi:uncharacterized integral membrane protein
MGAVFVLLVLVLIVLNKKKVEHISEL